MRVRVASSTPATRPCRDLPRYKSEDSARAHYRSNGRTVIACVHCGGWHIVKPAKVAA